MDTARTAAMLAATITTGWMAGLFYAFSIAVMPALRRSDDRTLIETMQQVNRAILNGWFLLGYLGALVSTGTALALSIPSGPAVLPLTGAFVTYAAAMALTAAVHIPLNKALDAAAPAHTMDAPTAATVAQAFTPRWTRANHARTALCTASLTFLAWSLLSHATS
ncbi:DUF1772 domain-containing protein [Streptomyces sp. NPDC012888]|uniref:anthrone oxygenase family protein n=1 Tax=Streptomyces sp. NPDC012888 TaxID=3364855 RepID=UPI0036A97A27